MRKIYFDDSVNDSINTPQVDTNGVETEEIEYWLEDYEIIN